MTNAGALPAALGYLSNWWQEAASPAAFDTLLAGWVRACGWCAAGFIWPDEGGTVVRVAPAGYESDSVLAAELPEVLRQVRAGEPAVFVPTAQSAGRVYAPVAFAGRIPGFLWAERGSGQTWPDADYASVALTGKTLERSPVATALVGAVNGTDRLAQRINDAAVIAGRMAHEIDGLLTGIIGFSDLTLPLLQPGSQAAKYVAESGKIGHRGLELTQQLHQFSRSGQINPTPGSVPLAVGMEQVRLKSVTPPGVQFEKDFSPDLPPVAVAAGPLQIVLGQLLVNAIDACPKGGIIRVTARVIELSVTETREYLGKVEAGPHVLVTVSDTGPGIKPEVRRRLLAEPFFTTKTRHRGLGLAVAFRILSVHRGGVQLDSVPPPGPGTVARVVLPLARLNTDGSGK